ncbi:hypothetical protein HDU84_004113 [Entophlyctis sp. JEL0112]|nr:hypothetical protein HDU84_004113 [Entophlyctis sp. JEL0112]
MLQAADALSSLLMEEHPRPNREGCPRIEVVKSSRISSVLSSKGDALPVAEIDKIINEEASPWFQRRSDPPVARILEPALYTPWALCHIRRSKNLEAAYGIHNAFLAAHIKVARKHSGTHKKDTISPESLDRHKIMHYWKLCRVVVNAAISEANWNVAFSAIKKGLQVFPLGRRDAVALIVPFLKSVLGKADDRDFGVGMGTADKCFRKLMDLAKQVQLGQNGANFGDYGWIENLPYPLPPLYFALTLSYLSKKGDVTATLALFEKARTSSHILSKYRRDELLLISRFFYGIVARQLFLHSIETLRPLIEDYDELQANAHSAMLAYHTASGKTSLKAAELSLYKTLVNHPQIYLKVSVLESLRDRYPLESKQRKSIEYEILRASKKQFHPSAFVEELHFEYLEHLLDNLGSSEEK